MTLSELYRRVQNIIVTARVVETMAAEGKMLVQVKYTDAVDGQEHISGWLPVATKNNSWVKIWMPPMVDEQVIVLRPFGIGDKGLVLTGIHWMECQELEDSSEHTAIVQFKDGTQIKYDSDTKLLSIVGVERVEIDGNLRISGVLEEGVPVESVAGAFE